MSEGFIIKCESKNNGWDTDTANIYISAYEELGELIKNKSKNFNRIQELIYLCKDGQQMGIGYLQH